MKRIKSLFIIFLVLTTGLLTEIQAEDNGVMEQIIQSAYKALLNKDAGLGRYTVIVTRKGTVELGRPIRTVITYQITFNGLKKIAAKYLRGEVNGLPVSEERLQELRIGKTRESVTGPRFLADSFQESLVLFFRDDYIRRCSLEGTEVVDNLETYKLKFSPPGNEKIGEVYLFIEKINFEIIKAVIDGKPDDKEIAAVIIVNYSKSIGDYYLPASIQLEASGPVQIEGQNNSYQYRGEISFSDYRRI